MLGLALLSDWPYRRWVPGKSGATGHPGGELCEGGRYPVCLLLFASSRAPDLLAPSIAGRYRRRIGFGTNGKWHSDQLASGWLSLRFRRYAGSANGSGRDPAFWGHRPSDSRLKQHSPRSGSGKTDSSDSPAFTRDAPVQARAIIRSGVHHSIGRRNLSPRQLRAG